MMRLLVLGTVERNEVLAVPSFDLLAEIEMPLLPMCLAAGEVNQSLYSSSKVPSLSLTLQ